MAKMIGPCTAGKLHSDDPLGRGTTPTEAHLSSWQLAWPPVFADRSSKDKGSTDWVYANEIFKFYLGAQVNSKPEELTLS